MESLSCAGIAFLDGKIFAARRNTCGEMTGKWEFPGGKVEDGEDVRAALIREFNEELGVEIECGEKLGECIFEHKGVVRRLIAHKVRFLSVEFSLSDHSECRWLTLEEAVRLDWTPSDYAILKQIL
ncbi:MAG: NUDIX domain-containing protein [Spirochaetaceae bacterium]|jgi:8-oxo-dGTP diphosphatase|nr:NUDIX domain-containing protein [Spirochaetaceae bacterium]